ncbi:hypothetical protein RCL_jg19983.t1 [Rhizophagus clarus]|uniref:Uncharacterized protein n=1 Tax=Rhizophagus clarus TaxID=94130 RepID=A0A8H3QJA7_9GLOM|nr:hypothetical protein RCL_jg19983.t1 [Rhizophagus clarus]
MRRPASDACTSDNCHGSFPSRYSGTYSFEKKRLKFPDYCKAMKLCNYLNFTLFTFNKDIDPMSCFENRWSAYPDIW